MIRYRIYTVGTDGHFAGPPKEVECANDKEAIAAALQMKNGLDMEIWDYKRFVIRLTVRRCTAVPDERRVPVPSPSKPRPNSGALVRWVALMGRMSCSVVGNSSMISRPRARAHVRARTREAVSKLWKQKNKQMTRKEAEGKRARRYRDRAKKSRASAVKTRDLPTRPGLIQFAQLCEILANSIEAGLGDDLELPRVRRPLPEAMR
jgi:hypothetical protein